jgi:hypothetical protein
MEVIADAAAPVRLMKRVSPTPLCRRGRAAPCRNHEGRSDNIIEKMALGAVSKTVVALAVSMR